MGFNISFTHPWFLFAIVIGLILAFIPHFKIAKKYRRNRTRIVSLVLHCIVLFLGVFVLAGMSFNYYEKNDKNEIIILVDTSDSSEAASDARDDFIDTVLTYGKYDGYRIGIVKFGYDCVYAVPLTSDISSIYDNYIASEDPDNSATNIAAALSYAKTLFEHPTTSKIVLVSDGKQTDGDASRVCRSIAASGIKIDTCYLDTFNSLNDAQVISAEFPNTHIGIGQAYSLSYSIKSNVPSEYRVTVTDNGVVTDDITVAAVKGKNDYSIAHKFDDGGLHEVVVAVTSTNDAIEDNNEYHTYVNIEAYNKILVLERRTGESGNLVNILNETGVYDTEIVDISDYDSVPMTIDQMRNYDQIILNNIHISDMPEGFDAILNEYVKVYGGGVFTVGGDDDKGEPNAYKRDGMYGTKYQDMLPVQTINYTPPVGLMIIIDKSGSMQMDDASTGLKYVEVAAKGAQSVLDSLTERDYVGVMTLESQYGLVLPMTPRTQEAKIRNAINSVTEESGGGTVFYDALERAGQQLNALTQVDKKHIIIVTDGMPGDQKDPDTGNPMYEDLIEKLYNENNITTSVVLLGQAEGSDAAKKMETATTKGHGMVHPLVNMTSLGLKLKEDLNAPEIKEINMKTFNPKVNDIFSPILSDVEFPQAGENQNLLGFTLDGFYGVKAKRDASVIIVGDFSVPIYAEWKYGNGMVGSFMCDISGHYSGTMVSDDNARVLFRNIINHLMPTSNIRPNELSLKLSTGNFENTLNVYTTLEDGQKVDGYIVNTSRPDAKQIPISSVSDLSDALKREEGCYVTLALNKDNYYSRTTFVAKEAGIYQIVVNKYDADGNIIATANEFREFSYSSEYDLYLDTTIITGDELMTEIAERGMGSVVADIEDPIEVFEGFITRIDKNYDPRVLFLIIAMCLFLLDIAIRKFKFKWPHELIRAYKEKKNKK